jgi:hypothetical protein
VFDRLNQTAPGFFRMLQTELFQTNILHLGRLTDPSKTGKKENLSLQNLPDLVTDADLKKTLTDLLAVERRSSLAIGEIAGSRTMILRWRPMRPRHRSKP